MNRDVRLAARTRHVCRGRASGTTGRSASQVVMQEAARRLRVSADQRRRAPARSDVSVHVRLRRDDQPHGIHGRSASVAGRTEQYSYGDAKGEVKLPDSKPTEPGNGLASARLGIAIQSSTPMGRRSPRRSSTTPGNPPSLWHGVRLVSFLNPCIAAPAPVRIPSGKPLTLRYPGRDAGRHIRAGSTGRLAAEWRK